MEIDTPLNFQTLFESIPGLYAVYSPEFRFVEGSDSYFQAVGIQRKKTLGRPVFEVLAESCDRIPTKELKASLQQVLTSQKPHTLHYTTAIPKDRNFTPAASVESTVKTDSHPLSWLSVHSPIFDRNGNLTHILRKIEDLTVSAQAIQQPLRQTVKTATQQLEMLLAGINDAFYTLNRDWQFTYVNESFCELIGMTRAQILGNSLWELLPETVGTDLQTQFQQALQEQTPRRTEYFYESWNRWCVHQLYPATEGLTVITTETTARKRSELLLVEQNKLLALISSQEPIEDCLRAVCQSIAKLDTGTRACILMADEHQFSLGKALLPKGRHKGNFAIAPDFPNELYTQTKNAPSREQVLGSYGLAMCNGMPVTCIDIEKDSQWTAKWRELCLEQGILACHCIPIVGEYEQTYGSLMLCFEEAKLPTLWAIQLAEFGAQYAAIAFDRDRTSLALRQSESRYRTLFESIDEGFCICEMLFEAEGQPSDFRLLETNPMFTQLTGIGSKPGKTIRELELELEDYWYEAFFKVVQTGDPIRMERRVAALGGWFDVYAFGIGEPSSHQFALLFTNTTARKHVEETLQQREQESRNILSSIRDGFIALDDDWCFTYVNGQAEVLLNRTATDLIGKDIWKEYPGNLGSPFEAAYRQAKKQKKASSVTAFYPDHDRWYQVRAYPAQHGITIYFQNVTDAKQAELERQETIQQLSAIYDGTDRYMGLVAPDGTLLRANRASLEFNNLKESAVVGQPIWETAWFQYTPGVPQRIQQSIEHVLQGESIRFDSPIVTSVGDIQTFDISFYPIRNDAGEVTFVVFEGTDITPRATAQEALYDSEERFHALADNISQFAWIADERGAIVWYNQRWFDYTGLTPEASMGKGWQQMHHPDHHQDAVQKFERRIKSGEAWEDVFPIRGKEGDYRWFLSRAVPVHDRHNRVSRWFGTNTDITQRMQAEKEKEQLLKREQNARMAAEEANRMKDEFLAVVSHELRTPLNPILGWSQILQKKKLSEPMTHQALSIIEKNAKTQAHLVDDLLDVSRILGGKLNLNASPTRLAPPLEAAIETVQAAATEKSIEIRTAIAPAVGMVSGDAVRLQQIFWNLLSNAVKFTPSKGVINVVLEQHEAEARIVISDSGQGIQADFLPLVFEHFRQQDGSSTRKFGGLGLGLAVVRDLVLLHGGTIQVESDGQGQGSTFTVRLPMMRAV